MHSSVYREEEKGENITRHVGHLITRLTVSLFGTAAGLSKAKDYANERQDKNLSVRFFYFVEGWPVANDDEDE